MRLQAGVDSRAAHALTSVRGGARWQSQCTAQPHAAGPMHLLHVPTAEPLIHRTVLAQPVALHQLADLYAFNEQLLRVGGRERGSMKVAAGSR